MESGNGIVCAKQVNGPNYCTHRKTSTVQSEEGQCEEGQDPSYKKINQSLLLSLSWTYMYLSETLLQLI